MNRQMLPYIKHIANRNLLYITENYTQYVAIAYKGKESEKQYTHTHTHIYNMNHFAVCLKLTVLQFKKKNSRPSGHFPLLHQGSTVFQALSVHLHPHLPAHQTLPGQSPFLPAAWGLPGPSWRDESEHRGCPIRAKCPEAQKPPASCGRGHEAVTPALHLCSLRFLPPAASGVRGLDPLNL